MTWIRRYKQNKLLTTILILRLQVMQDYVFHCFIHVDYRVESVIVDDNICKNCSHLILKWFLPNSFGEMCFSQESYKQMHKNFWNRTISQFSLKTNLCYTDVVKFIHFTLGFKYHYKLMYSPTRFYVASKYVSPHDSSNISFDNNNI